MKKFKAGDKVEVADNKEAVVIGYYAEKMVEVRLWQSHRHIGDICLDEKDIKLRRE